MKGEMETKDHLDKDCGEGEKQGRVEELKCSQGGGRVLVRSNLYWCAET